MFVLEWVMNSFWTEFYPAMLALAKLDIEGFSRNSAVLFPFQAKCHYQSFGAGGSIQTLDSLCILPQNVVNEKVFAFLFVWYIFMFLVSVVDIIKTAKSIAMKICRINDIRGMFHGASIRHEQFCLEYSDKGYWFLLLAFKKNLNSVLFNDFLSTLLMIDDLSTTNVSSVIVEIP